MDKTRAATEQAVHQLAEHRVALRAAALMLEGQQVPEPLGEILSTLVRQADALEILGLALASRVEALEAFSGDLLDRIGGVEETVYGPDGL